MNEPPVIGQQIIDKACADVADLSDVSLNEHASRFAAAHEAIASVLQS